MQEGSVTDYKVKFEELKALMLNFQLTLKESYFVLKFIDGLSDVLRPIVRMVFPTTVEQAVEKARLHEMTLEAISREHRRHPNGYTKSNQQIGDIPKIAKALRSRLVGARSEGRPGMEQGIQDDMGGRVATGGIIETSTEEKDVEMNPVTIAKKFEGQPINRDEVA